MALPQPPDMPPPISYDLIREGGLKAENNIRSIGLLYYLCAILCGLGSVAGGFALAAHIMDGKAGFPVEEAIILAVMFGLGGLYIFLGHALRQVKPWTRVPVCILAVLSLLSIPLGTIIGIVILVTMLGKNGQYVFSREYQEAIKHTPHMRYMPKTSKVSIAILIILVALIVAIAVWAISFA